MNVKHLSVFAAAVSAGAIVAGCTMPVDRSIGPIVGDFNGSHQSASVGVSYKEQYSVHDAFSLSLGYANPRDYDALVFQADLVSFGRIPEASQTTMYVGLGMGLATWTADSPTSHDIDFWLRVPIGVLRRFALDNGEVFFELAPTLGLNHYDSVIGFGGGVRWKIGL